MEIRLHNHGPDICLINHYAPHSGRPLDEKAQHWDNLQQIVRTRSQAIPTFIVGDTSARLHGSTSEVEDQVMGTHVFGHGAQHVPNLPESQRDSRQCLVDFCVANDYVVSNTMFQKPDRKKCTYKDTATNGFTGPWTPNRFAQLDLILAPNTYKNSIKDVEARPDIAINSDHAIVTADIQVKLKAKVPPKHEVVQRYHNPTEQQKQTYNEHIRNSFRLKRDNQDMVTNCAGFVSCVKIAASQAFSKKNRRTMKPYISRDTWRLIEDRQAARLHGRTDQEKVINREIIKQARRDKQNWKLERLQDLTDIKTSWRNIRIEKKETSPKFYNMRDIHGNRVPVNKKADALAQYLHERHWAPSENSRPVEFNRRQILQANLNMNTNSFSADEVSAAIRSLKTDKAPGPDGAITELFKSLDTQNIASLTQCLNFMWEAKHVPDDFAAAQVASVYKKGNHDNPENYRPISLLNTTYKLCAYMLKTRIAESIDSQIWNTQFGFRKGKSTAEALFCVRRLTDVVEQGHESLFLIFLDWEKAFDKIDHEKMFHSLERLSIPVELLDAIKSLYRMPLFQVTHGSQKSKWFKQRTGIRQGCPLSPYLFILTMHVMFSDVKDRFNDPRLQKTFQGINFQDLLYADDTFIVARSRKSANDYLNLIEEDSAYLHLKLNHSKCCYIAYNCHGVLRFRNGERMKCAEETTYLGASITKIVDPKNEIRKRISATMAVLKKLDIFWLRANCNKKWKLLVYNSVIVSKLLYGLESLEPTDATGKLLNTFQLKGLRKILRLHTTFIQRQNTNEYVYRRANEVLNSPTEGNGRKIKPLTEVLEERRLKLLGHVLRREREHPLHQAAFKTQSALPRETEQRRVGRPRKFWTTSNMEKAWEIITIHDGALQNSLFDKHNRHMRERIIDQARAYLPPFD